MKKQLIATTLFAILLSGCYSEMPVSHSKIKKCHNPRPHICTMIYAPVCDPVTGKTYSNACVACSHKEVIFYRPGKCH